MLVAFPVSLIFFLFLFFDAVAANFMPHYALVFFPSPARENTSLELYICLRSGFDGLQSCYSSVYSKTSKMMDF